jgi:hypothetical protein
MTKEFKEILLPLVKEVVDLVEKVKILLSNKLLV